MYKQQWQTRMMLALRSDLGPRSQALMQGFGSVGTKIPEHGNPPLPYALINLQRYTYMPLSMPIQIFGAFSK